MLTDLTELTTDYTWTDSGEEILGEFPCLGLSVYISRETSVPVYAIRPICSLKELNAWLGQAGPPR